MNQAVTNARKALTAAFLQEDNDKIAEAQQSVAKQLQSNRALLEPSLRVCFAQDRLQRSMSTGDAVKIAQAEMNLHHG
eukprot:235586-Hanusia_phi.AAC.1